MLIGLALLFLLSISSAANVRAAEDSEALESRVKAAFLYKFSSYVEWPEVAFSQPQAPFTIAVVGAEPIVTALKQAVAGRRVNDRPIVVRQLRPGESMAGVHILFLGGNAAAQLGPLLKAARPYSVLTVTESEGGLAEGSVINFILDDQRVRFEISRESANRSKLRLSSRLLAVAKNVKEGR